MSGLQWTDAHLQVVDEATGAVVASERLHRDPNDIALDAACAGFARMARGYDINLSRDYENERAEYQRVLARAAHVSAVRTYFAFLRATVEAEFDACNKAGIVLDFGIPVTRVWSAALCKFVVRMKLKDTR